MKPLIILVAGFFLSCLFFTNTSCTKKTDCVALINCVDSTGTVALPNVNVQLYATVKTASGGTVVADVKATGVTGSDGKVMFTFKLPAIYDIKGSIKTGTRTLVGTGIIKLEEGKTVANTVTMR
jgi:hypothetical protein